MNEKRYLSQSAQLYKEQLSSVFENVFELGACYRAEKSFTNRHLCEIYVLDFEMAFADYNDVMSTLENLVHTVCAAIKEKCEEELKTLNQWETFIVPEVPFPGIPIKMYYSYWMKKLMFIWNSEKTFRPKLIGN